VPETIAPPTVLIPIILRVIVELVTNTLTPEPATTPVQFPETRQDERLTFTVTLPLVETPVNELWVIVDSIKSTRYPVG